MNEKLRLSKESKHFIRGFILALVLCLSFFSLMLSSLPYKMFLDSEGNIGWTIKQGYVDDFRQGHFVEETKFSIMVVIFVMIVAGMFSWLILNIIFE